MAFRHLAKFQGFVCKAVQYVRSSGLAPDTGEVVLDIKDLKKIFIRRQAVAPWRTQGGIEVDSPATALAFFQNFRRGTTVTALPEIKPPADGGLHEFGSLELSSQFISTAGGGEKLTPIVYKDIYIDVAGFQELNQGMAAQRLHDRGDVIVPITDIRKFYPSAGVLMNRINIRLKGGGWDETTGAIDDVTKEFTRPFSAAEVIRFLFSQLPGSPQVLRGGKDHLDDLTLDPPTDIDGTGELVLPWLQKILDQLGLEPKMQPDGNYFVTKKNSTVPTYGKIAVSATQTEDVGRIVDEQKTIQLFEVPPVVIVLGKPRNFRRTAFCVPVIIDPADNKVKRLESTLVSWGYSVDKARFQAAMPKEKRYSDVPPTPDRKKIVVLPAGPARKQPVAVEAPGTTSGRTLLTNLHVHHSRREALEKYAFKLYAPIASIDPDTDELIDPDNALVHFMPMNDFAIYERELTEQQKSFFATEKRKKGDFGDYFISQPVIRSKTHKQMKFNNFKEVEDYFDGVKASIQETELADIRLSILKKQRLQADIADQIQKEVATQLPTSLDNKQAVADYFSNSGQSTEFVDMELDVQQALKLVDQFGKIKSVILQRDMTASVRVTVEYAKQYQREINEMKKQETKIIESIKKQDDRFKAFKRVYDRLGYVEVYGNAPHSIAQDAKIKDPRTGLIEFPRIQGHMERPFALDLEMNGSLGGIVEDANVTVTYGYETRTNSIYDVTSVLFAAQESKDKDGNIFAKPVLVGVNRPSPVKPTPVRSPEMILYHNEEITPFNITEVVTEAADKAATIIAGPKSSQGFVYTLTGFRKAVLAAGVDRIEHIWNVDGDEAARTIVAANSRGTRGLMPGVNVGRRIRSVEVESRQLFQTGRTIPGPQ